VRADDVALGADAEQLALDGVAVVLAGQRRGDHLLERLEQALPIPATAVREEQGTRYVYEIEEGTVQRRTVELGMATRAGMVDVRSGLEAGDIIVRNNLGQLREGAAARVAQVTAQAYP